MRNDRRGRDGSGALRATWPAPAAPVDRDEGVVHLLRLADGADAVVGPDILPSFAAAGLVYADGARIRLVSSDRLPLR